MNLKKRPFGVWLVTLVYLILIYKTISPYLLRSLGFVYVIKQEVITPASTPISTLASVAAIALGIEGVVSVVSLFLMRRKSVLLFGVLLILTALLFLLEAMTVNWGNISEYRLILFLPIFSGEIINLIIQIVSLLYVKNLAKNNLLS